MSGRGRGRSDSRKGRGFSHKPKPSGKPSGDTKSETKKNINDFNYYIGSARQASDYETTTSFIINYIKKTYDYGNDIASALKSLTPIDVNAWKPSMQVSLAKDDKDREAETRQFDIEFKADYDEFKNRERAYGNNLIKAYALLWERCTKGMKNKIESRKDFKTMENDPIKLLQAIKEHALNYQEHRYSMSIILDAVRTLLSTKQREGESLQDYTKRFRVATEVMESHLGSPIVLTKVITSMQGYDENDKVKREKFAKVAFEQFLAYMYLDNADQAKYGSILKGLRTQQSLGNDQYPKTVTESNNVLSSHPFDSNTSKQAKGKKPGDQNNDKPNDSNKEEQEVTLSFAQLEGKCYCCGKAGHKSPSCRDKNKPRDQWAIHKAEQSFAQPTGRSESSPNESNSVGNAASNSTQTGIQENNTTSWAGTHIQFQQYHNEMRDWILLDNQSTTTIFCNSRYVNNVRSAGGETMTLITNGGILNTDQVADIPDWGVVWYNSNAITNIFSFAEMANRYKITYDSDKENAFVVHMPNRQVRFTKTEAGLYVHKPGEHSTTRKQHKLQLLNTVEENQTFYTQRQFEQAKRARDLYHALGTPSINDFKAMLRLNTIANNPVTVKDIEIAEQIFGPDIGTIKGKSTRQTPLPVVEDYIDIPDELIKAQQDVVLCIDGMHVNGINFLTTISKNLYYRTAQYVGSKTAGVYKQALGFCSPHLQSRRIQRKGNPIVTTNSDPLLDSFANEYGIRMNYANPNDHVPEAERNNRVIKERVRAAYHRLPYKRLPKIMIKVLVMDAAKKLNFFPAKNGVSKYYSPRMILHQKNLEYGKHCKYVFGTYVQAHDEQPTNTNAARSLDCIYLRYVDSHQGGHELLHLQTNAIIVRRRVTPLPITPAIIRQVHSIAERDSVAEGLKITNKIGHLLYDSAWIAGVDYNEVEFEEDNEDDDDYVMINDNEYPEENEEDDESDDYDEMDPDEIQGLINENNQLAHDQEDANPNPVEPENDQDIVGHEESVHDDKDQDEVNDEVQVNADDVTVTSNNDMDDDEDEGIDPTIPRTRSGRPVRPVDRMNLLQTNLPTQTANHEEYSMANAVVIARVIHQMNQGINVTIEHKENQFVQTYSLAKGLKKFEQQGRKAAYDEMKQLHDRVVFKPIKVEHLTPSERRRAMESLIFLTEKRDGRIKARTCANGSSQREYMERDEAASPTAATESHLLTATIDAKQQRDVMTADIPNAFVQTDVGEQKVGERITMKIRGPLVDMLVEIDPTTYQDFVVYENKSKVVYVTMLKALYGMLQSSLLYYKKFRKDIEGIGFKVNPYDPCVANRMVNGKQHTITWHVDDLKSSHVNPKVNDDFLVWLKEKYASDNIGEVKVVRGKRHDYLAMVLDFSVPGVLKVDMTEYVEAMVNDFPVKLTGNCTCPWNDKLFRVSDKERKLDPQKAKVFHTFVMKGMFVAKRARQDILPGIAFLSQRVREPTEEDWLKLCKVMNFLKATKDDVASMSADNTQTISWYIDAAFAVHKDYKSHTGAVLTLGSGAITSDSTKQNVNTRSSTEAELVAADDELSKVLWTKRFLEAQGFAVNANVIYRDNTSTMKLEENGKASSGKRTRHYDIKYFYITDLISRKEVEIKYCPTDDMIGDYMSKPLIGAKFKQFRKAIMNLG